MTSAPPRWRHPRAMLTVGCEHPVIARQIDARSRHQRRQPGNEVQKLDKIAGSDFVLPKADPKGGGQEARSNMTWVVPSRNGVFS